MDHPEMNELNMALAIAVVLLVAVGIWIFVTDPKQIVEETSHPAPAPTVDGWKEHQKVLRPEKKEQLKAMTEGLH